MSYRATFLLGIPDNNQVNVGGIDKRGGLMYRLAGNAEFHQYVQVPKANKKNMLILGSGEPIAQLPPTNVIVNCITDPDTTGKSLKKAAALTNAIRKQYPHIPIFNDPAKIADTARDRIYQKYSGYPGVRIPKVVRVKPNSARHVLQLAKEHNIKFPFLTRKCGSHEGRDFYLITEETVGQLQKYAYDGTELYITKFINYKSADNLYHKARLVIIGGQICPRHYMTGESWLVHGNLHEDYMASRVETKKDELFFLNNFRKIISKQTLESFMEIYKESGLDYLGFDFAINRKGEAVIFEINSAQNTFLSLDFNHFPYMRAVRDNIIKTFNKSILLKLKSHMQVTATVQ